jgi:lysozyme
VGIWTIGVGHVIDDHDRYAWQHLRDGRGRYTITEAMVLDLLRIDVKEAENAVNGVGRGSWRNPNMFDSLVSLVFNVGAGVVAATWFRRCVMFEDLWLAEQHFPHWDHAGGRRIRGLSIRRAEELAWMRKGAPK